MEFKQKNENIFHYMNLVNYDCNKSVLSMSQGCYCLGYYTYLHQVKLCKKALCFDSNIPSEYLNQLNYCDAIKL